MLMGFKKRIIAFQASVTAALIAGAGMAEAQVYIGSNGSRGGANFSTIAENINRSMEEIPGLVSGLSYLLGIVMGILGIFKLRDHVDNPTNTPLKEGAVRLVAGGALFALPILYDAMVNTIGAGAGSVRPPTLNRVEFNVR